MEAKEVKETYLPTLVDVWAIGFLIAQQGANKQSINVTRTAVHTAYERAQGAVKIRNEMLATRERNPEEE